MISGMPAITSTSASNGSGLTEIVFTGDSAWAERDLDAFFGEGRAELGADDLAGAIRRVAGVGSPAVAA